MSLSFKPSKNNELCAVLNPNNQNIYIEPDMKEIDFETGHISNEDRNNKVKKLKIMDSNEFFFPAVHDWSKDEMNQRIYVTGKSGSGKSYYFIRRYVIAYHKMYKNNDIYLFSAKLEDRALDDLKFIKRVDIDEDIVNNPIDIRQLKNSLCIFDDIEKFQTTKITKAVLHLLEELLENGRSMNIFLVYSHHQPTDYKNTRLQLFESTAIVLFPNSKTGGKHDYDYLLDKYLPISKVNKNIIKNSKSEFVYISKANPQIIISDKYILTE